MIGTQYMLLTDRHMFQPPSPTGLPHELFQLEGGEELRPHDSCFLFSPQNTPTRQALLFPPHRCGSDAMFTASA